MVAAAVLASGPAAAWAQDPAPPPPPPPPVCPDAPASIADPDLTDTDRIVRELRELRREQAASCAVLAHDVEQSATVTVDSSAADPVHVELPAADPSPVATDVNVVSEPSGPQSTARQLGFLRADVWGLVGLVCALPFFYALWRTVMPRA